ncbi:signal protein [Synechococcus sp. A15-60]|uniref:signal protein n=1 Tax=Synechococcus sp. A15-60 TaxID=1050655 RepID=UPI001648311F|nr:signal protein [Synechococcus sp. A15-60]QNI48962.1 putative hAMP domain protein [Synechococcus sp. A15-60]
MQQRLWLILPTAGIPLLIVLFVVLWQAVQRQNLMLQELVDRVEKLEGFDRAEQKTSQELLQQQLGALQARQRRLQGKIFDLESWRSGSRERERRLLERLNPGPFQSPDTLQAPPEPSINP